jgi:hypothetical protein
MTHDQVGKIVFGPPLEFRPDSLCAIAKRIRQDWRSVSPHAKPYLDAMSELNTIHDRYYIVLRFLGNAGTWHGDTAKAIKAQLRQMLASIRRA